MGCVGNQQTLSPVGCADAPSAVWPSVTVTHKEPSQACCDLARPPAMPCCVLITDTNCVLRHLAPAQATHCRSNDACEQRKSAADAWRGNTQTPHHHHHHHHQPTLSTYLATQPALKHCCQGLTECTCPASATAATSPSRKSLQDSLPTSRPSNRRQHCCLQQAGAAHTSHTHAPGAQTHTQFQTTAQSCSKSWSQGDDHARTEGQTLEGWGS